MSIQKWHEKMKLEDVEPEAESASDPQETSDVHCEGPAEQVDKEEPEDLT